MTTQSYPIKAMLILLAVFLSKTSGRPVLSLKQSNNIPQFGSVLFTPQDLEKTFWTVGDLAALYSRWYFHSLIPAPEIPVKINDTYIYRHLNNFQDIYVTLSKHVMDPKTQYVMTTAFADTIGGHIKARLLPAAKYGYYGGQVSYDTVKTVQRFYDDIKSFLHTDGSHWHGPSDDIYRAVSGSLPHLARTRRVTEDECRQLPFYDKIETGYIPPIPKIDWNRNATLILPIKKEVNSLSFPEAARELQMYYDLVTGCLGSYPMSLKEFQRKFNTWLENDVTSHFDDDNVYPGLYGVLCRSRPDDTSTTVGSHYGLPRTATIVVIILMVELLWCLPAMYCAYFVKGKLNFCNILCRGGGSLDRDFYENSPESPSSKTNKSDRKPSSEVEKDMEANECCKKGSRHSKSCFSKLKCVSKKNPKPCDCKDFEKELLPIIKSLKTDKETLAQDYTKTNTKTGFSKLKCLCKSKSKNGHIPISVKTTHSKNECNCKKSHYKERSNSEKRQINIPPRSTTDFENKTSTAINTKTRDCDSRKADTVYDENRVLSICECRPTEMKETGEIIENDTVKVEHEYELRSFEAKDTKLNKSCGAFKTMSYNPINSENKNQMEKKHVDDGIKIMSSKIEVDKGTKAAKPLLNITPRSHSIAQTKSKKHVDIENIIQDKINMSTNKHKSLSSSNILCEKSTDHPFQTIQNTSIQCCLPKIVHSYYKFDTSPILCQCKKSDTGKYLGINLKIAKKSIHGQKYKNLSEKRLRKEEFFSDKNRRECTNVDKSPDIFESKHLECQCKIYSDEEHVESKHTSDQRVKRIISKDRVSIKNCECTETITPGCECKEETNPEFPSSLNKAVKIKKCECTRSNQSSDLTQLRKQQRTCDCMPGTKKGLLSIENSNNKKSVHMKKCECKALSHSRNLTDIYKKKPMCPCNPSSENELLRSDNITNNKKNVHIKKCICTDWSKSSIFTTINKNKSRCECTAGSEKGVSSLESNSTKKGGQRKICECTPWSKSSKSTENIRKHLICECTPISEKQIKKATNINVQKCKCTEWDKSAYSTTFKVRKRHKCDCKKTLGEQSDKKLVDKKSCHCLVNTKLSDKVEFKDNKHKCECKEDTKTDFTNLKKKSDKRAAIKTCECTEIRDYSEINKIVPIDNCECTSSTEHNENPNEKTGHQFKWFFKNSKAKGETSKSVKKKKGNEFTTISYSCCNISTNTRNIIGIHESNPYDSETELLIRCCADNKRHLQTSYKTANTSNQNNEILCDKKTINPDRNLISTDHIKKDKGNAVKYKYTGKNISAEQWPIQNEMCRNDGTSNTVLDQAKEVPGGSVLKSGSRTLNKIPQDSQISIMKDKHVTVDEGHKVRSDTTQSETSLLYKLFDKVCHKNPKEASHPAYSQKYSMEKPGIDETKGIETTSSKSKYHMLKTSPDKGFKSKYSTRCQTTPSPTPSPEYLQKRISCDQYLRPDDLVAKDELGSRLINLSEKVLSCEDCFKYGDECPRHYQSVAETLTNVLLRSGSDAINVASIAYNTPHIIRIRAVPKPELNRLGIRKGTNKCSQYYPSCFIRREHKTVSTYVNTKRIDSRKHRQHKSSSKRPKVVKVDAANTIIVRHSDVQCSTIDIKDSMLQPSAKSEDKPKQIDLKEGTPDTLQASKTSSLNTIYHSNTMSFLRDTKQSKVAPQFYGNVLGYSTGFSHSSFSLGETEPFVGDARPEQIHHQMIQVGLNMVKNIGQRGNKKSAYKSLFHSNLPTQPGNTTHQADYQHTRNTGPCEKKAQDAQKATKMQQVYTKIISKPQTKDSPLEDKPRDFIIIPGCVVRAHFSKKLKTLATDDMWKRKKKKCNRLNVTI